KVWTSGAQFSRWGILIARTAVDVPKHEGITYFVIDMDQPGIEIRPIREMTGRSIFNEVFLTDARVPAANQIGGLGEGWSVALTTLANERTMLGAGS
ncbi:acyl-CoA dehydrogenase family protein, partial [Klebsiella pneumoniae]|uniref:acyl-CoA dehydrogenase family protein n=1 Tax=Klebsiella pneumoniae TaxID=573 RepID=UPI00210EB8DF